MRSFVKGLPKLYIFENYRFKIKVGDDDDDDDDLGLMFSHYRLC